MKLKTRLALTSAVGILVAGLLTSQGYFPWTDSFTWTADGGDEYDEREVEFIAAWSPKTSLAGDVRAKAFVNGSKVGNADMLGRRSSLKRTADAKVGDSVSMEIVAPEKMDRITCTIRQKGSDRVYVIRPLDNAAVNYCTGVVH